MRTNYVQTNYAICFQYKNGKSSALKIGWNTRNTLWSILLQEKNQCLLSLHLCCFTLNNRKNLFRIYVNCFNIIIQTILWMSPDNKKVKKKWLQIQKKEITKYSSLCKYSVVSIKRTGSLNYFGVFSHPVLFFMY